jgi:hypothetical protein
MKEDGNWDKRNHLKVYSALNKLLIRDLKGAASCEDIFTMHVKA